MRGVLQRIQDTPRIRLAVLPTPLEPLPRLGAALGVPRLWVKRDDGAGLELGGNKTRKLEFLLAEALAQGAGLVLTAGGVQSNHARMTAAAACRLGLRAVLLLNDPEPAESQGNLLLDRLFGADVRFCPGASMLELQELMETAAEASLGRGESSYIIPVGGSTPLGSLGYVLAVHEVAEQARERGLRVGAMVVATGSTGTLAGILVGARAFLPEARVYGISVSRPVARAQQNCAEIVHGAAERVGLPWRPEAGEMPIRGDWIGDGYGVPTASGLQVIQLAARLEGLLFDHVYTGKALAGLRGLAGQGELRSDEVVLFWHTGGTPALFAHPELYAAVN